MPFPSGRTLYTFAGISFARVAENDEIVPWFFAEDQVTKDPVLPLTTIGGANISKTYLDLGAAVAPPLLFRASCLNATDRYNLKNARRTIGTLTSTTGPFSATVLLYKAVPVNVGSYSGWFIDLGFELVVS